MSRFGFQSEIFNRHRTRWNLVVYRSAKDRVPIRHLLTSSFRAFECNSEFFRDESLADVLSILAEYSAFSTVIAGTSSFGFSAARTKLLYQID